MRMMEKRSNRLSLLGESGGDYFLGRSSCWQRRWFADGGRGASPRSTAWDGLVEQEMEWRGHRHGSRRLFHMLLYHAPRPARAVQVGGIFCLGASLVEGKLEGIHEEKLPCY